MRFSPNYVEAYIALGDALRRAGRVEASMEPSRGAACQSEGGRRPVRVRDGSRAPRAAREARLVRRCRAPAPGSAGLPARACPVARSSAGRSVRDGRQAQTIVEGLLPSMKTLDVGETLAMSLAEQGQFADAVSVQRDVLTQPARPASHPRPLAWPRTFSATSGVCPAASRGRRTMSSIPPGRRSTPRCSRHRSAGANR